MKRIVSVAAVALMIIAPCFGHTPGYPTLGPASTPSISGPAHWREMITLVRTYEDNLPSSAYVIQVNAQGQPVHIWRWQPKGSTVWRDCGVYSRRNPGGYCGGMSVVSAKTGHKGSWVKFYY